VFVLLDGKRAKATVGFSKVRITSRKHSHADGRRVNERTVLFRGRKKVGPRALKSRQEGRGDWGRGFFEGAEIFLENEVLLLEKKKKKEKKGRLVVGGRNSSMQK